MSTPSFQIGDAIRLGNATGANPDDTTRTAFTDIAGADADPTTVTLTVRPPTGTDLTYVWPTLGSATALLTREVLGRFYYDLALTLAGKWYWQLSSTGTVTTSEEGLLYVLRSPF